MFIVTSVLLEARRGWPWLDGGISGILFNSSLGVWSGVIVRINHVCMIRQKVPGASIGE